MAGKGNGKFDLESVGKATDAISGENQPSGKATQESAGDGRGQDPASAFGAADRIATDKAGNVKYTADGRPAKKRGRKPGQKGKTSGRNKADIVDGSATALVGIHYMLATALKAPEFEISQEEGARIASSMQDVQEAFGVDIDPRTQSLMALTGVLASCYGPRIIMYNMRKKVEQKGKQQRADNRAAPQAQPAAPPSPMPEKKSSKKSQEQPAQFTGPLTGKIAEEYPSDYGPVGAAEKVKRML